MFVILLLNINNIPGDCVVATGAQPTFCGTESGVIQTQGLISKSQRTCEGFFHTQHSSQMLRCHSTFWKSQHFLRNATLTEYEVSIYLILLYKQENFCQQKDHITYMKHKISYAHQRDSPSELSMSFPTTTHLLFSLYHLTNTEIQQKLEEKLRKKKCQAEKTLFFNLFGKISFHWVLATKYFSPRQVV